MKKTNNNQDNSSGLDTQIPQKSIEDKVLELEELLAKMDSEDCSLKESAQILKQAKQIQAEILQDIEGIKGELIDLPEDPQSPDLS